MLIGAHLAVDATRFLTSIPAQISIPVDPRVKFAEFRAWAPRAVTADVQRQREMRVAAVSEGRSGQHLP